MKKGISIIVLVITIIVMTILTGVVIVNTVGNMNNAELVSFSSELKDVESKVMEYYILNKEIPLIESESSYTKAELLALNTTDGSSELGTEIDTNLDDSSEFYKVDLNKLGVKSSDKGLGEISTDFFVVAYPSFRVYYIAGIKTDGIYYFSLTNKLPGVETVTVLGEDNSAVGTLVSAGIDITYNASYTSDLNAVIKTEMASGETLHMSVTGGTEYLIVTSLGENNLNFSSLTDIAETTAGITVTGFTLTEARKVDGTKTGSVYDSTGRVVDRYIEIIKKSSGTEIGRIKMDLNNFSVINPVIDSDTIVEGSTNNTVTLDLTVGDAPIQEIRYEYLEINNGGVEEYYFDNITVLDVEYLFAAGKKITVTNNQAVIVVPKDITSINLIVLDKAGNYTMYEQATVN